MKNHKTTQMAQDAVKTEIRKGKLAKGNDVLNMLPDIVDSVHIDYDELRNSIENCLYSKNPLNSLLNLFGIQFILKEKTINDLVKSSSDFNGAFSKTEASHSNSWLTLDEEKVKNVVENLACELQSIENEAAVAYENEKKRSDDLFSKNETLRKENNKLSQTLDRTERMVSERVQYILSVNGENSKDNEQLTELLKDMNIDVHWSSAETSFDDEEMFTQFRINNLPKVNLKPCLTRNGSVYIKGTRIIKE